MNEQEREDFRNLLLERRQEIMDGAGRTVHGMVRTKESFPDPTDRASMESSRNAMLRIRDRERKLLNKIDEALERIEEGSFGICEECGEAIGAERLRARPMTTMCISCKADQEDAEKRRKQR